MNQLSFTITRQLHTQILVVGGGVAGCAAALAAARCGAQVMLLESGGVLGGMAGAGLVTPLDAIKTKKTKQPLGGILTELYGEIRALGEKYCANDGIADSYKGACVPHVTKYVLLKKLVEAGVELRFHTTLVSVETQGRRVCAAVALDKSGFVLIHADSFIDATGDGELIFHAGADFALGSEAGVFEALSSNQMNNRHFSDEKYTEYAQDGVMQPVSIFFVMGGVDFPVAEKLNNRALTFDDLGIDRERFAAWPFAGSLGFEMSDEHVPMPQGRVLVSRGPREDMAVVNMSRVTGINGADADSLNEGEIKAQLQLMAIVDFLQTFIPGFEGSYLVQSGNTLGVRETRRLRGRYVLSGSEAIRCATHPDTIARGTYMIDIHDPNGRSGAIGGYIKGEFYDIPYGCLLPKEFDNLLAVGRCISADHVAHASTRIQGTCIMTGQAAGTAAALALDENITPAALDVKKLQEKLLQDGVYLK